MGSSFCRLSRLKLQNEDPRLNVLYIVSWREINQYSLRFVEKAAPIDFPSVDNEQNI